MTLKINSRLAVFDCDGTLVDSQASIISAMVSSFETHSYPTPDPEQIRRIVGLPIRVGIEKLLPDARFSEIKKLEDSYKESFGKIRREGKIQDPLYPGVFDVLSTLENDGWILGIATGKSTRGLKMILEKYDLIDKFYTLQTSDTAPGKPDPSMLINAMNETGCNAENTVMIGDTTFDIEMAINAKVHPIGVSWGYHPQDELEKAGADTIAENFFILPKILNIMNIDKS